MKRSDSLRLGWAYAHLHQVLAAEKELLEVTFHYGMGVRVHLDTYHLSGEMYVFVSSNDKSLSSLTQTSTEICVESHHLCEGTYDLPPMSETGAVCVALPPGAFQRLLSMPKKKRKKGLKRSLF